MLFRSQGTGLAGLDGPAQRLAALGLGSHGGEAETVSGVESLEEGGESGFASFVDVAAGDSDLIAWCLAEFLDLGEQFGTGEHALVVGRGSSVAVLVRTGNLARIAPHQMTAEQLYDAIRDVIGEAIESEPGLSSFELVGVLSLLTAEAQAAAMEGGEEGED